MLKEEMRVALNEGLRLLDTRPVPARLPLPGGDGYGLPRFDADVMAIELSIFLDWYLPAQGRTPAPADRASFEAVWRPLVDRLARAETHWLLRDFHSPNLMWLDAREGIRRIGLIDYQDALVGPSAYDLASLLQDARIPVPAALEDELFALYCERRRAADAGFDEDGFREAYAICCAQRAVRIMGTFTRLRDRDGKPGYVRLIPQLQSYLARALDHPVLGDLGGWLAERGALGSPTEPSTLADVCAGRRV